MEETIQNFKNDCSTHTVSDLSSPTEPHQSEEVSSEGKNAKQIKCQRCPSTILVPGTATLVTNEFTLPDSNMKKTEDISDSDHKKYWCVDNMYSFENVGFSKTVDGVKYLICADCEIGPIGWHDLNTKLSYVSLSKISYC